MFIWYYITMNKQKVLKILNDLKPYWDLAEWMIALIEAGFMDKETYQNMLFMIASAIKKMPEWKDKEKVKKEFEELKESEKKEKVKEKSD